MVRQALLPAQWIIVNDGSSDGSEEILRAAAQQYQFITVLSRPDRGSRDVGAGVVAAFNHGIGAVDIRAFDYVCKLDADIELPRNYFRDLVTRMEADPNLGNLSGKVYTRSDSGRLVRERMGDENAVGAAKFYRVQCYRDIGGFVSEVGWDGIDGHMCRLNGWIGASLDEPSLQLIQRRWMGESGSGLWAGRKRWGRGKYYMGSSPYYVGAVAVYRLLEHPYVLGGIGILLGYMAEALRGGRQLRSQAAREYIRRFEMAALITGKRAATARFNKMARMAGVKRTRAPVAMQGAGTSQL